jgi:hypothetical protein
MNDTFWDKSLSMIEIYINTSTSINIQIGSGPGKSGVANMTGVGTGTYHLPVNDDVFISAYPNDASTTSRLILTFRLIGVEADTTVQFEIDFWKRFIGIIVGLIVLIAIALGLWLWY